MFKPGDRVLCIRQVGPETHRNACVGQVYTVKDVDSYGTLLWLEEMRNSHSSFTVSRFRLVSDSYPFKSTPVSGLTAFLDSHK